MKNLLIPVTAAERLQAELEPLKDAVNLYLMHSGDKITFNGEAVEPGSVDIHYGWFGRDVMFGEFGREYAIQLLKSQGLEWVQSASAGLDNAFFKKLAEKGIRLTNSDAQAPAIAEYVVASVLERYQDFVIRRQHQTNHDWQDNDFREIYGSNWLVIGYGNIGRRIGIMASGFEANVTGVKRSHTTAHGANQIVTYDEVPALLGEQDVVVLSCALTDETRDMVNEQFLSNMKPGAVLVNIGRGDLIDEDALLKTLNAGDLDYAILDVFRTEPLPKDSPFWDHDRVLVTPHSSNRGIGTNERGDKLFMTNLNAITANKPLTNEVNTAELL